MIPNSLSPRSAGAIRSFQHFGALRVLRASCSVLKAMPSAPA